VWLVSTRFFLASFGFEKGCVEKTFYL